MNKYEQTISEIEDFLDNCKRQKLSSANIIVNKEQMDEYISELRIRTPDEIKKYQRIISNRDAILDAAQSEAQKKLDEAYREVEELISEHEIMQQAYAEAQNVVDAAQEQAQEILDSAVNDANDIRMSAMQYTDNILADLQNIISHTMQNVTEKYESFMKAMDKSLEVVTANRNELYPQEAPAVEPAEEPVDENMPTEEVTAEDYEDYTVDLNDQ